jgi:hypothetical protein
MFYTTIYGKFLKPQTACIPFGLGVFFRLEKHKKAPQTEGKASGLGF